MLKVSRIIFWSCCIYIGCIGPGTQWGVANAAEQLITAVFSPDPSNPSHTKFVNTTPNYGYCQSLPGQCIGAFSIRFPVDFVSTQDLDPAETLVDPRKGAYFDFPASNKSVMVVNDSTGEAFEIKFRIAGFGGSYYLRDPTWHGHLWTSTWVSAPRPCTYGGVGSGSARYYDFFWKLPPSATNACVKRNLVVIPTPFRYEGMSIMYELTTPNPLSMSAGTYSGSLTLRVGPGQDFDFGDVMSASDDQITFNFKLSVNHLFKVDFVPGSYRAILQPRDGWKGWVYNGQRAPALMAEQHFNISSSGSFHMYLDCQYEVAGTCGIQLSDASGESPLGVDVSVSLPSGIVVLPGNLPVKKVPLTVGKANAVEFSTHSIQLFKAGRLHFDVPATTTEKMVKHPGKTYRGLATVIFDVNL